MKITVIIAPNKINRPTVIPNKNKYRKWNFAGRAAFATL